MKLYFLRNHKVYSISIFILVSMMLLLSCGNNKTSEYELLEACITGDSSTVEKLLLQKVDANLVLKNKENKIFNRTYANIIKSTFFYHDIGDTYFSNNETKCTPLIAASINGNVEIAKLLLKYGADVNYKEPSTFYTSLACAVSNDYFEYSNYLIENEADVNITFMYGSSCLHIAATANNTEIVELLLKSGIRIIDFPESPLIIAIGNGNKRIVELLLENNADVNDYDVFSKIYTGKTPLVIAVEKHDVEMLNLLLRYNPSINAISKNFSEGKEYTVLDVLNQINNKQIMDIFTDYIDKHSGYKNFIWGMSVNEVRNLCPDIKSETYIRWGAPSYVILYLYNSEIISSVPNPLSKEAGRITVYESDSEDLYFYFVDGRLVAVQVWFFNENILSELVKKYGSVNPVGGSYLRYEYMTATWDNDITRYIVWEGDLPLERVYYISRSWLSPLLEKTLSEFQSDKNKTSSKLD